jgi:hypothetical protein
MFSKKTLARREKGRELVEGIFTAYPAPQSEGQSPERGG